MIRLGLIIPSSNTTMESEFSKLLPEGFTVHTARLKLRNVTVKSLAEMEQEIEKESSKLADADVDIISYGCTSGSLYKGLGYDKEIEKRIEKASGKSAVATAGAVVRTLNHLKITKIAVATPYIDEINKLERDFLFLNGFHVVDLKGLGILDNLKIGRIDRRTLMDLVLDLNHEQAEGIFLSCTNLPTISVIEELEDLLRKPVISSNTATLWAVLKKVGVPIKINGYGKLLKDI